MCINCWHEEGRPYEFSDLARQWAPKFADANKFGALHVVVEDWNLDDNSLDFCRSYEGVTADEVELIDALKSMSEPERWATALNADYPDFDPVNEIAKWEKSA